MIDFAATTGASMGKTVDRHWDSRTYTSRAAEPSDSPRTVFQAYIPHPISGWAPDLSAALWHQVSAATERCHELRRSTATGSFPAEWLLERAESIASSTIEGIRPSARKVARAEVQLTLFGERPPDDDMRALRNIRVTQHARDLAAEGSGLTIEALRSLHRTLMGDDPIAGKIRERQNWVGAGALGGPLQASHVGPPPEAVPSLLEDLVSFVNRDGDGNPIVRAALAHVQFETIHPFPDGNGRTGRALLQYMCLREGLAGRVALPLSSALMLAKQDYFDALDATRVVCEMDDSLRSHALHPWVDLLAQAADHACRLQERLNEHVETLLHQWTVKARTRRIRPSSAAFRLLSRLPSNPVLNIKRARELLGTNERTTRHAVSRLADAGILVQRSAGRRNRVFECSDMMDAFTEAAREQPADNLTLASRGPSELNGDQLSTTTTSQSGLPSLCNAKTVRGGRCGHPRPMPGGKCQAGHVRPA